MLVPRKLGYPQTISTKIMFLSSISEICTSTTLISSTTRFRFSLKIKGGAGATRKKPPSARGLGIPLSVVLEQVSTLLIKDLPLLLYSLDRDLALLLNVHGKSHTHARSGFFTLVFVAEIILT